MPKSSNAFCMLVDECKPPKAKFSLDEIPDLSGQVIIVTGGSSGIGKETARVLLTKNAKVYIATRNEQNSKAVIEDLSAKTGKEAFFLKLDLSDLNSVKASAEEFMKRETQLHVLFNNAGVMGVPVEQLTPQGYDLHFGTNVLGHFYFTKLLLPILKSTAQTTIDKKVRVINIASITHLYCPALNYDLLTDTPARRKYSPDSLYGHSKYAMVVYATELARRYGDDGIVSIGINPGNIKTELQRHMGPAQRWMTDLILYPVELGALTQLYAGTMPDAANYKYMIPWARVGESRSGTTEPELCRKLWDWMDEQVKAY
ncbi:NAD(P)-binding protein [Hymenopellis radicata]|nr:NAD(P)-binding protein [Hymenopellis radicata]